MELPSWILCVANASFGFFLQPGYQETKLGRKDADPPIGMASDGHRSYSASGSKRVDLESLKFRRRPDTKGFMVDEIVHVAEISR